MFKRLIGNMFGGSRTPARRGGTRRSPALRVEGLEARDNPSGLGDLWDGAVYYGGAAVDGLAEGAVNIVTGARDAVVETVRVGGDLVTIGATNRGRFDPSRALAFALSPVGAILTADPDQIDPATLNSGLFRGAAQTAGNPQAAAAFDRQLVFGIATLGVGPLAVSGYDAVATGDSTQFSQQAGGFGVMVLVPYGIGKGVVVLRGGAAVEAAGATAGDAAGTVRAGALVAVEGEFNTLARVVRFVEGAAPAGDELATVNTRLQQARQIMAAEVERLQAIDDAVRTPAESAALRNLSRNACAEGAINLERAIASGEINPLDGNTALRQLSGRDLLYEPNLPNASATSPFRGTPADLPQALGDALPNAGGRAILVIERAGGEAGHMVNVENIGGNVWLYEVYSGQAAPLAQPVGVIAIEAFVDLAEVAPQGSYTIVVVAP